MSRAGLRRVRNGEVALICACALLGAMDWDDGAWGPMMARAERLADAVPGAGESMAGAALGLLVCRLSDLQGVLEAARKLPEGERNWTDAGYAQAQLRQAVRDCLTRLGDRGWTIWAGEGAMPAAGDLIEEGAA